MADLCAYWFRKAADHLPRCTSDDPLAGRAGLVGTQNIRNNESREGGLDYVARTGTILEAVENQPWSGEANVHVSIANWAKTQDVALLPRVRRLWFKAEDPWAKEARRNELAVRQRSSMSSIAVSASLSIPPSPAALTWLVPNVWLAVSTPRWCFEGVQTGHDGFVIDAAEARRLLQNPEHQPYVKPFINGSDLLSGRYASEPEFVIDLSELDALEASALPRLMAIPRERVLVDWKNDAADEKRNLAATGENTRTGWTSGGP